MLKMLKKWTLLTRFQKILIVTAGLLAVMVAAGYLDFSSLTLPLPETIRHQEQQLQEIQQQLVRLEELKHRQHNQLLEMRQSVAPFFWQLGGKAPSAEIQAELERLARTENITIRSMGSPRGVEVTEHVHKVEVSININGSMREITRFLAAIEQSRRKFYWHTCTLRPMQAQNLDAISLNGRVQAFFLTPGPELIILGQEG